MKPEEFLFAPQEVVELVRKALGEKNAFFSFRNRGVLRGAKLLEEAAAICRSEYRNNTTNMYLKALKDYSSKLYLTAAEWYYSAKSLDMHCAMSLKAAEIYREQGAVQSRLDCLLRALEYFKTISDDLSIVTLNVEIGKLLYDRNDYMDAKQYYDDAVKHGANTDAILERQAELLYKCDLKQEAAKQFETLAFKYPTGKRQTSTRLMFYDIEFHFEVQTMEIEIGFSNKMQEIRLWRGQSHLFASCLCKDVYSPEFEENLEKYAKLPEFEDEYNILRILPHITFYEEFYKVQPLLRKYDKKKKLSSILTTLLLEFKGSLTSEYDMHI
jgi:hypothetical protein